MNLTDKLKEIVGEENVSIKDEDKLCYSTDASQLEGTVEAVVWVTETEQIRNLIRLANMRDLNIVPRGAGTSLEGGTIPTNSIILDLNKLNKIVALHREEHFVIVQPGVTIKRLNEILKRFDLFFPIIPNSYKVSTIGGAVATNSYGNYSYKYGKTGDWVMELEIVDGSGKILTLKDPTKIIGTEGTLAIISSIKLKVVKPIETISSYFIKFNNAQELLDKVKEAKQDDSIISLQYVDKTLSGLVNKNDETHKLIVEYNLDLKGEPGNQNTTRENLFKGLHKLKYHKIKQFSVPEEKIEEFLKFTRRNKLPTFGNFGVNTFQIFFHKRTEKFFPELIGFIKQIGGKPLNYGKIHKEHLPEKDKEHYIKQKKVYDPNYIINKGKIL